MTNGDSNEAHEHDERDSERDRGILTREDRQYLRGESELSEGAEYNTRRRIRQRVLDTLLDFCIIQESLEDHDREQIFDEVPIDALEATAAFAYEAADAREIPYEHLSNHAIEKVVWRWLDSDAYSVSVGSNHEVKIEQQGMEPQMTSIERSLNAGTSAYDLNPGDKALLFDQLLKRDDFDATEAAIEEWHTFVEQMIEQHRERQDK